MRHAIVSFGFLSRLGNWSPDFVMPYLQFTQALKDKKVGDGGDGFEKLISNLSKHQQGELERVFNDFAEKREIDLEGLAAKVRSILLYHTKSSLWGKGELDLFVGFVGEWCFKRWEIKAEEARLLVDDFMAKARSVREKIQKAQNKDERSQTHIAKGESDPAIGSPGGHDGENGQRDLCEIPAVFQSDL